MQDISLHKNKMCIITMSMSRLNFLLAVTEAPTDQGGSLAGIELAQSEWLRLHGEQAMSNQCLL